MKLPRIRLKKNEEKRVLSGHPWIFSNEVEAIDGATPSGGDLVEIRRTDGAYLATALYNPHSLIVARVLSLAPAQPLTSLDDSFFQNRLEAALHRRKHIRSETNSFRLCYGESDDLPGVIVDVYGNVASVQITSLGMDMRKEHLYNALESLLSPTAIVERSDTPLRDLEGLSQRSLVVRGNLPAKVDIEENGLVFQADILHGQKTGFFLDQRENRRRIRPFAEGARVLDLFSNEGGFSLNALRAGASSVLAVDASAPALHRLEANVLANGLQAEKIRAMEIDIMESVGGDPLETDGFDLIILDPPSMTRSKKTVATARKGYIRLNTSAMQWLRPGGVLATASCSHHISEEVFLEILRESSRRSGVRMQIVSRGEQPPDHPVLLSMPETRYLKFFILRKLD